MVPRYIGLDLHARYIHGCEWTPEADDGQKERHFRLPNTPDGWAQLLPQLDRTCWVALEVTGSAFEVHDVLSAHVGRVLLANPIDLKRFGSGRHTDRVDAARLAKMLAVDDSYRLGPAPAHARGPPPGVLSRSPGLKPATRDQSSQERVAAPRSGAPARDRRATLAHPGARGGAAGVGSRDPPERLSPDQGAGGGD